MKIMSGQKQAWMLALLFATVAVAVCIVWYVTGGLNQTQVECPVVVAPPPTPPVPPTPPEPPVPPKKKCGTPTPTPTPAPPVVREVLKAQAICDHQGDENTKCTDERYVVVRALECNMEINLVEVRCQGILLEPDSALRINVGEMRLYGAFAEKLHGAKLELTVYYTVKIGPCVRLLKTSVIYCTVTPAY